MSCGAGSALSPLVCRKLILATGLGNNDRPMHSLLKKLASHVFRTWARAPRTQSAPWVDGLVLVVCLIVAVVGLGTSLYPIWGPHVRGYQALSLEYKLIVGVAGLPFACMGLQGIYGYVFSRPVGSALGEPAGLPAITPDGQPADQVLDDAEDTPSEHLQDYVRTVAAEARKGADERALTDDDIVRVLDAYVALCGNVNLGKGYEPEDLGEDFWVTFYSWTNANGGMLIPLFASSNTPDWDSKRRSWLGVGQAGPGKLVAYTRWLLQNAVDIDRIAGREKFKVPALLLNKSDLRGLELAPYQALLFHDSRQESMLCAAVFPHAGSEDTTQLVETTGEDSRGQRVRYLFGVLSFCAATPEKTQKIQTSGYLKKIRDDAAFLGHVLATHYGDALNNGDSRGISVIDKAKRERTSVVDPQPTQRRLPNTAPERPDLGSSEKKKRNKK